MTFQVGPPSQSFDQLTRRIRSDRRAQGRTEKVHQEEVAAVIAQELMTM